jgi:hypothetical protein
MNAGITGIHCFYADFKNLRQRIYISCNLGKSGSS